MADADRAPYNFSTAGRTTASATSTQHHRRTPMTNREPLAIAAPWWRSWPPSSTSSSRSA